MMTRMILILQFFLFVTGCNSDLQNNGDSTNIIGKYGFYEPYDSSYSELYIREDSLEIFSMNFGSEGTYNYIFRNDTISFAKRKYQVELKNGGFISLKDSSVSFRLHRFQDARIIYSKNGVHPIHLRRCYVLVHEGIISMTEALNYLQTIKPLPKKEEFIHINELIKSEK